MTTGSIAFIHIPKTAGSTFYSILRTVLPPTRLYKLHQTPEAIAALRRLSSRDHIGVIYGHIDYRTAVEFVPPERCVTLLRHPIDRIISYYFYHKYMSRDPEHDLAARLPFGEWIHQSRLLEVDNGMLRRLLGVGDDVGFGECSPDMLAEAKAVLGRFMMVGLMSRFEDSYALLAKLCGWKMRAYQAKNVNRRRLSAQELSAEEIAYIKRYNEYDLALYAYAEELFTRRLADIDISRELAELHERQHHSWKRRSDAVRNSAFRSWRNLLRKHPAYRLFG